MTKNNFKTMLTVIFVLIVIFFLINAASKTIEYDTQCNEMGYDGIITAAGFSTGKCWKFDSNNNIRSQDGSVLAWNR